MAADEVALPYAPRAGPSAATRGWGFLACCTLFTVMFSVLTGCGTGRVPQAASSRAAAAKATGAAGIEGLLKKALLPQFKGAAAPAWDPPLVTPVSAGRDAGAQRRYQVGFPVSDPRCRMWALGAWSAAAHTPAVEGGGRAAMTMMFPRPSGKTRAWPLGELILAMPSTAMAAVPAGGVPPYCQRVRVRLPAISGPDGTRGEAGRNGWVTEIIRQQRVTSLGQRAWAYMFTYDTTGPLETQWVEDVRFGNYIVEVRAWYLGDDYLPILQQAARAAYIRALSVLG